MVKLSPEVVQLLGQPDDSVIITTALRWAEQGWPDFPPPTQRQAPGDSESAQEGRQVRRSMRRTRPRVSDGTRDPEKICRTFAGRPDANIGGATTGRVVFDFDIQHGAYRLDVFPPTREHLSGRGNGNVHVIYRADDDLARQIKPGTRVLGHGIDVRAKAGSYVVLPPSTHPKTGQPYTIVDSSVPERHLTDDNVRAIWAVYCAKLPDKSSPAPSHDLPVGGVRLGGSNIVELLSNPPERGSGQTNDWLTKVSGHCAHQYRDKRDLHVLHVRLAAAMVDSSYEETETILESIWGSSRPSRSRRTNASS
jgi:hypothetical protein